MQWGWEAGGSGTQATGQEVRVKGSLLLLPTLIPLTQSCTDSGRGVLMGVGVPPRSAQAFTQ